MEKTRKELTLDSLFKWWVAIALVLPFIDVVTTILFTSKYGIGAEGNKIGLFFLNTFGNVGFLLMYLFSATYLVITFFIVRDFPTKVLHFFRIKIKDEEKNKKFSIIWVMLLLIFTYLIVYIINLSTFLL